MGQDRYGLYGELEIKDQTIRMRWIPPGAYQMGDHQAKETENEEKLKETDVKGFWLAETTCTQALWKAVMRKNPSSFKEESGAENLPVETVSWNDCREFIDEINNSIPSGRFKLPTEAEWEYACRAGTTTPYWFGDEITDKQANFARKVGKTVYVRSFPCNGWGLYQMHGNVWEWCEDEIWGTARVVRGGGWDGVAGNCRSACRVGGRPGGRSGGVGFRVARDQ